MSEKNLPNQENQTLNKKNKFALLKKIYGKFKTNLCYTKHLNALIFIAIGIFITLGFQTIKYRYEMAIVKKHLNNFYHDFDSDYVNFIDDQNDIEREVTRMQRRMDRIFSQHYNFFENNHFKNQNQNLSGINNSSVKLHEDEKNFYYELSFNGFKKEEINVEIKDNILTFQAQSKISDSNNEKNNNSQAINNSSFSYSFLLSNFNSSSTTSTDPASKADITKLDDKIIVKIPKKLS